MAGTRKNARPAPGKGAAAGGRGARPEFSGALTALITPFKADGAVDWDGLGELIEAQVAGGVDGLVPCGTTGESATMSHEEHREVVRFTVQAAAGRARVLAGTGSNATAEAVELTRAAAGDGADGSLQVAPYYNKPTQEGLFAHFKAIGEATGGFPQVLYNIPGRCGVEIAVDTVARLAGLPFVVGIKEAGGSLDRVSSLLAACGICLVSGDDSLTVPMMSVGARGVISVISNLYPADVKRLVDAAAAGDYATARRLHYRLLPVVRLLFVENNPMGIKTAMRLAGRPAGAFRPPLCEMRPENVAANSLNVESNSGKVSLLKLKVSKELKVDDDFGEIELEQAFAASYDLHTNSGSITVNGAKGKVKAYTDFGGIKIENAQSVTLDVSTNSGTVEFSGSLGTGPHMIKSDFGEIDLTLSADSALNVDLKTDFGSIKSDLPVTVTLNGGSNSDGEQVVGSINGGGEQLKVETNSGNVTIHASK